ncbi:hypothetical protein TNIN_367931 [Trichonephila inaurata madagascariensis]|uniref:Uncharacterized protein n=1 Tax=Trichonephila inaurata madagascariensis TaxID=2747483 RepID=A0A8X7BWZ4_9ARAC|nr:hypothetical protein TNIN_367931 [Trichonephila inaurata madagascariensis]
MRHCIGDGPCKILYHSQVVKYLNYFSCPALDGLFIDIAFRNNPRTHYGSLLTPFHLLKCSLTGLQWNQDSILRFAQKLMIVTPRLASSCGLTKVGTHYLPLDLKVLT